MEEAEREKQQIVDSEQSKETRGREGEMLPGCVMLRDRKMGRMREKRIAKGEDRERERERMDKERKRERGRERERDTEGEREKERDSE